MKRPIFRIPGIGVAAALFAVLVAGPNLSRASAQSELSASNDSKHPQFVYISGQVNVPNRYVYTNGLTLSAAIKMAKGVTPEASLTKVALERNGEKPMSFDRKAIEQGKAKDVELRPGDKVFIPKK